MSIRQIGKEMIFKFCQRMNPQLRGWWLVPPYPLLHVFLSHVISEVSAAESFVIHSLLLLSSSTMMYVAVARWTLTFAFFH